MPEGSAWAYINGQWSVIPDPVSEIEEAGDTFDQMITKMGYGPSTVWGDANDSGYGVEFHAPSLSKTPPHPYLVCIKINGTSEGIYVRSLPDLLQLLNLCATPLIATLLTSYSEEYSEVLHRLTSDTKMEIHREKQSEFHKRKKTQRP